MSKNHDKTTDAPRGWLFNHAIYQLSDIFYLHAISNTTEHVQRLLRCNVFYALSGELSSPSSGLRSFLSATHGGSLPKTYVEKHEWAPWQRHISMLEFEFEHSAPNLKQSAHLIPDSMNSSLCFRMIVIEDGWQRRHNSASINESMSIATRKRTWIRTTAYKVFVVNNCKYEQIELQAVIGACGG